HRQYLPTGEEHSLEIRVQDPIPRLFAETGQFRVAGAYTHVVMQDVDSAIGVERRPREGATVLRPRDVGFANQTLAAFGFDHRLRLARRLPIPIDKNHASAFARKENGRGAAVADSVPRRLSRAHHYGDFILKSHDSNPATPSSSLTPSVLSAIDTRLYWPTVKIRSSSCRMSYVAASASQTASEMNACPRNSSTARSSAASNSLQPWASGPSLTRSISSSVSPAFLPITTCCPHSYSARQSQPTRRISNSRSRGGSVDLF